MNKRHSMIVLAIELAVAIMVVISVVYLGTPLPNPSPPATRLGVYVAVAQGVTWIRWSGIAMTYVCTYPYNLTESNLEPYNVSVQALVNLSASPAWPFGPMKWRTDLQPGMSVTRSSEFAWGGTPNMTSASQCQDSKVLLVSYQVVREG